MDSYIVYIIAGGGGALLLLLVLLVWCRLRRRSQQKGGDFPPAELRREVPEVVVEGPATTQTPYKRGRRASPGSESGVDVSFTTPRRSATPTEDYSSYSDDTLTENGVENAATGTLSLGTATAKMRLKQLWTTPVMVLQLNTSESFNRRLSDVALQLYNTFEPRERTGEFSSKTNRFFNWQKEQHALPVDRQDPKFLTMCHAREFVELQRLMYHSHAEYLRNVGVAEDVIAAHQPDSLHCWATVQVDGTGHAQHSHPDAVVSGCYYSLVPPGCGPVVFDDPRGPRHPFDSTYTVSPRVGAMVLFPSWLLHTVMPTPGSAPRVSWAFNVLGQWEEFTGGNSPSK